MYLTCHRASWDTKYIEEAKFVRNIVETQLNALLHPTHECLIEKLAIPGLTIGYVLAFQKVIFGTMAYLPERPVKHGGASPAQWEFYWHTIKTDNEILQA